MEHEDVGNLIGGSRFDTYKHRPNVFYVTQTIDQLPPLFAGLAKDLTDANGLSPSKPET